jgi:hypothetical protein
MSHSPAYYQDPDHRVTTYLHDSDVAPPAPAAAHLSPVPQLLPGHPYEHRRESRLSEVNPTENPIRNGYPSDSWDSSYSRHPRQPSQHSQHSPQLHHHSHRRIPGESIFSNSEPPVVAPMTFVSSPYLDNGSMLTQTSYSSGAVRKEERVRGSWTDHSSYMSGDNHHLGATRIQKRAIHNEEPLADGNQDALLMLVRISLHSLFISWRLWLTARPAFIVSIIHPGPHFFLLRIPIYPLRITLCSFRLTSSHLLLHPILSNNIFPRTAVPPLGASITYP